MIEIQNEIVTIDGPAGAGKSTVAKLVASSLGFKYLDTGATYRVLTLKIIRELVDIKDEASIKKMLDCIDIGFDDEGNVLLDCQVVNENIRSDEVNKLVPDVSVLKVVREAMVCLQRSITKSGEYVVDGRDIGSVVLPNALYKFYLDANVAERAMRRFAEESAKGNSTTFEQVKQSIEQRDKIDRERSISPLVVPKDAIIIDSSFMSIAEVVTEIVMRVNYIKEKNK